MEAWAEKLVTFLAGMSALALFVTGFVIAVILAHEAPMALAILGASAMISAAIFFRPPTVSTSTRTYLATFEGMPEEDRENLRKLLQRQLAATQPQDE